MSKPQLILDVAGVIVTNLSPSFWEEAASAAGIPYEALKHNFKNEIREPFWKGTVDEKHFWRWLCNYIPKLTADEARIWIQKHLRPLPAFDRITEWSRSADIHLLSNHREEWLMDLLEKLRPYLSSVIISSSAGYCKPDPRIYQLVESRLDSGSSMYIYVDDQEKNLAPAKELGWWRSLQIKMANGSTR